MAGYLFRQKENKREITYAQILLSSWQINEGVRLGMKIVIIVPKTGKKLKPLLKKKEIELRGTATTFYRVKEGRWGHVKYPGWINFETRGGLLIAEVQSRKKELEWQLLQAFIGYLHRHLGEHIDSISITFR